MKGNPEIVDRLGVLLRSEIVAINQYSLHAQLCGIWGYPALEEDIMVRIRGEREHAKELMNRMLFLGSAVFLGSKIWIEALPPISPKMTVASQFEFDSALELEAIRLYNEAIRLCANNDDNGTRALLEHILVEEEAHLSKIEEGMSRMALEGEADFLSSSAQSPEVAPPR